MRILVVDDDPTMREIAVAALSTAGHTMGTARDGGDGWQQLNEDPFDLVLIDLDMPEVDGYTLIQWIRADENLKHLPVIVVTSHEDEPAIDRAFEVGANSFVSKPVNWPLFRHRLRYVYRASVAERELRAAKDAAERSVRLKNSFMSVINHELRTPLTHIIGFAEVLQLQSNGPLGHPGYLDYVNEIAGAGRHLLGSITDVILLSRSLAGELELKEGEYTVSSILHEALEATTPLAQSAGVELAPSGGMNETRLACDIQMLSRCLIALLDNAVKFSPPGAQVRIECVAFPDGGFAFSIADDGSGMPPEQIAECYEPFVQSDMSFRRSAEGIGLGLTVARSLIELHGGVLALRSEIERGTTAMLSLPAQRLLA